MVKFAKHLLNSRISRAFRRIVLRFRKLEAQEVLSIFDEELMKVNSEIDRVQIRAIPQLLKNIPLDVFGKLLLDIPSRYDHIKAFFPSMASEEVQRNWTGTHGEVLLYQSLAFIKTLISGYAVITGKQIENATILDYGCGWGRLIRLLYKFTPFDNIYGVDPWDEAIKICQASGLKGNLAVSDYVPQTLPFDRKFDLIFAFSVFTHLSEKTTQVVLTTLRKHISTDGVLAITIRPKEYWYFHDGGSLAASMSKAHDTMGFAFTPHNRTPINGDITYGDTSMSLEYINKNVPQWKIRLVEWNEVDPYQVVLFLAPA